MKSVLISIRPEWCELIASGKKTIEVRKTVPKLETPFKCYIYETQGKTEVPWMDEEGHMIFRGRGMVIGEFECKDVLDFTLDPYGHHEYFISDDDLEASCLTYEELWNYGKGKTLYGWYISDLKIYDKPKPLSKFYTWKKCNSCRTTGYESSACIYDEDCKVPAIITRPPQSWCYVEGRIENA